MAIDRLGIKPAVILDGERKAYDPSTVEIIGENMRAKGEHP